MPVVILERLPLPSLKAYTSFSVLFLSLAIYYAHQTVHQERDLAKSNVNVTSNRTNDFNITSLDGNSTNNDTDVISGSTRTVHELKVPEEYIPLLLNVLFEEIWCVWIMINMAYCCLILVGKMIQKAVFGELRVSERQHIKDKFWNFVFYKFIFIFGVMNVQNMDEVFMWCAWFSVLGFLHLLTQLSKDRFEYLSFSPTTPKFTHAKVLGLLIFIQTLCFGLTVVCAYIGLYAGINTFAFMAAECFLLIIKTLNVIIRYGIHLWDLNHEGVWENRAIYVYYTQLVFEMAALSVDFMHHLHMLVWGNIFLSMASLVICMQLRYLFHEFQRRIKRHKNYLHVVKNMESRFPMATRDDLTEDSDDCAICWDKMESARKLPCGHMFHNACLRSWLEQDTSCPTCRTGLNDPQSAENPEQEVYQPPNAAGDADIVNPAEVPVNHTTNHFFHFDGSRYVSWLPSFSVEVTHTQIIGDGRAQQLQTSQLDNMARQVQNVFPSVPLSAIIEDLHTTRSVEQSIDNILEGRLVVPTISSRNVPEEPPDSNEEVLPETSQPEVEVAEPSHGNNFIMDENLPSFEPEENSLRVNEDPEVQSGQGFRFSKSSTERQEMLSQRKDLLLQQARRRFMSKNKSEHEDRSNLNENVSVRQATNSESLRQRAYEAAQRRMNNT